VTDADLDDTNYDGDGASGHGKDLAARTVVLVARVNGDELQDVKNIEDGEADSEESGALSSRCERPSAHSHTSSMTDAASKNVRAW
jgi:hypothetical protein